MYFSKSVETWRELNLSVLNTVQVDSHLWQGVFDSHLGQGVFDITMSSRYLQISARKSQCNWNIVESELDHSQP
jgi:hypothetical protein